MALVIDGHNLIGILPDIDLGDPNDEARLVSRLRAYRGGGGQAIVVFFDSGDLPSHNPTESSSGFQVRFSRPGETADDAIISFLAEKREPGQYAVVTNDHELAHRARMAGASVIPASEFATRLQRKPAPTKTEPEAGPNPQDPAFADLYAHFLKNGAGRRARAEPGQISVMVERLYGDDSDEAQKAAEWLGRNAGPEVIDALRDALTHSHMGVRAAAALALGSLRDVSVLPALEERLTNDVAGMVREAAAQALGLIGSRKAETALEKAAAADGKSKVRKAARAALDHIRARRT